jgi:pimeloyl-ACP methyl ester carboxylesterase
MHRQYVHVDSRSLAYLDSAPGNRALRVAVWIHAFPLGAGMWEPQFKAIPDGWRFIAPDLRGFGGSTIDTRTEQPPRLDDYAIDVLDVLRDLEIDDAVVAGCSMGGYVAFAVLRRAPALARGVILVDTRAGADSPEGRANRRSMLALLDREGPSGIARDMLPKLVGATTRVERPEVETVVRRLIIQQSADAIRGAVHRMMERPDALPVLQALTQPALIVVGDEDVLTPVDESRKMQAAAAAAAKAELVIVPRTGHLPNLEQPAAFNAAVASFLSRL